MADDDARAIRAVFAETKPVKTRGVVQIILEAPQREYLEILQTLGNPVPEESIWVAVARLDMEGVRVAKEKTEADKAIQRAALLSQKGAFQRWSRTEDGEGAKAWIRQACGVKSMAELKGNQSALQAYLTMEGRFREYVEGMK